MTNCQAAAPYQYTTWPAAPPYSFPGPIGHGIPAPAGSLMPLLIHPDVQCDHCGMDPICGPRYKSRVRHNYDLCIKCCTREGRGHEYDRHDVPYASGPAPAASVGDHPGVSCNQCGTLVVELMYERLGVCGNCYSSCSSPAPPTPPYMTSMPVTFAGLSFRDPHHLNATPAPQILDMPPALQCGSSCHGQEHASRPERHRSSGSHCVDNNNNKSHTGCHGRSQIEKHSSQSHKCQDDGNGSQDTPDSLQSGDDLSQPEGDDDQQATCKYDDPDLQDPYGDYDLSQQGTGNSSSPSENDPKKHSLQYHKRQDDGNGSQDTTDSLQSGDDLSQPEGDDDQQATCNYDDPDLQDPYGDYDLSQQGTGNSSSPSENDFYPGEQDIAGDTGLSDGGGIGYEIGFGTAYDTNLQYDGNGSGNGEFCLNQQNPGIDCNPGSGYQQQAVYCADDYGYPDSNQIDAANLDVPSDLNTYDDYLGSDDPDDHDGGCGSDPSSFDNGAFYPDNGC